MLKAPRPGFVKTRLAQEVGEIEALFIYRRLVEHQLKQLNKKFEIVICYTPFDAYGEMREWLGDEYHYEMQAEGDLGDRLRSIMQKLFNKNHFPVLFLGGDCPYIDEGVLDFVEQELVYHDIVIGPAKDGGYYLIGVRHNLPEIFNQIEWGTKRVFDQTIGLIDESNLSVKILGIAEDVDDLASWERATNCLKF